MTNTEFPFITRVDMGLMIPMTITAQDIEELASRTRCFYGLFLTAFITVVYLTLDVVGCWPIFLPFYNCLFVTPNMFLAKTFVLSRK